MTHFKRADVPLQPAKRITEHPNLPAPTIYIHHGASPTPTTVSQALGSWRAYQQAHFDRGWSDIAYTKGVMPTGDTVQGRGWERQGGATGSPYDSWSHSICAIGNYDVDRPTDAMVESIARLIRNAIDRRYLLPNPRIEPHRAVSSTACPGRHLVARIDDIRTLVANGGEPMPDPDEDLEEAQELVAKRYRQLGTALDELYEVIDE